MFGIRGKGKIEFFTEHEGLMPHAPIRASRFFPEWFKRMKSSHAVEPARKYPFGLGEELTLSNVNSTIKRCPGVISYMSEGYIVPLWSDFVVQVRENSIYAFGSNETAAASLHGRHIHFDTMPAQDEYYPDAVKFVNPWKVKTPKGWSLLVLAPFYHMEKRFKVLPGIIESDSYHHMHVNAFFNKGEADHQLKMGIPFIQVIPFPRDELECEVRVATDQDKKMIKDLRFRSDKFFKKNKAIRDINETD